MWDQVAGIARTAGTTPNDMLVHLVAERLRDRRRALALRKRADARWHAFTETSAGEPAEPLTVEPISEEELVNLSEAFRVDAEA